MKKILRYGQPFLYLLLLGSISAKAEAALLVQSTYSSNITSTSATLNIRVQNTSGSNSVDGVAIGWGGNSGTPYTNTTSGQNVPPNSTITISRNISGLSCGQTYYYAANWFGVFYGPEQTFTTTACDSTPPNISISAQEVSSGESSDDSSIQLTFTTNEPTVNFDASDVTVGNGSINNFSAVSSTVYTATLVPNSIGTVTVSVLAGVFTDAASNGNTASSVFEWNYGSDPTSKADVIDTLNATTQAANRFYSNSIKHANDRMQWLRRNQSSDLKSVQGINLHVDDPLLQQFISGDPKALSAFYLASNTTSQSDSRLGANVQTMADVEAPPMELVIASAQNSFGRVNLNPTAGKVLGDWYLWTAGNLTLAKDKNSVTNQSNDTESINLAIGMDKQLSNESIIGFALNLGQDDIDVGNAGSNLESDNVSLSMYTSIDSQELPPIDLVLGLGHMSLDSVRMDGTQVLTGSRNANMIFGSASIRKEPIIKGDFLLTPYAEINAAYTRLGSYTEQGGALALEYDRQNVKNYMIYLGVDADYKMAVNGGQLRPFARLAYGLDLSPESNADLRYVGDATGYRLKVDASATSHWIFRVGGDYQHNNGVSSSLVYERTQSVNSGHADSIRFRLAVPF